MKLVFATNNAHKLGEVRAFLGNAIQILSLEEAGFTGELPETGRTLEDNSLQKTRYLYQHTGLDCFGDDTGLEVAALGGRPGVDSAHYAGTRNTADNLNKVLQELAPYPDRRARFRTVITLVLGGQAYQFEGTVQGQLLAVPQGHEGFGYDPAFRPEAESRTFGQMTLAEKNCFSHRSRAIEKMAMFLGSKGPDHPA